VVINYLAHSKNDSGVPQLYSDHVLSVMCRSEHNITTATKYGNLTEEVKSFLLELIKISSYWHDAGKLDKHCQSILSGLTSSSKMLNHVDAGVSILLKKYYDTKNVIYLYSAGFVYAHHIGLPDFEGAFSNTGADYLALVPDFLIKPNEDILRDDRDLKELYNIEESCNRVRDYVDENVEEYLNIQKREVGDEPIPSKFYTLLPTGIEAEDIRMAFSCLVDADHSDTSDFYSGETAKNESRLCPIRRQIKLTKSVKRLLKKGSVGRNRRRQKTYYRTSKFRDFDNFLLNRATVGCGKTLSNMAIALRVARKNNCERIFVIAPYINIISQTVEVYRKSLILRGEDQSVVNEIHGKVEYDTPELRHASKLWDAPINVSTAVQFFESVFTNRTSRIRKYHLFANSVVIFDEYDKAMSHFHWGVTIEALYHLSKKYNIHFIFSSGTPIDYFSIYGKKSEFKDLMGNKFFLKLRSAEKNRIKYNNIGVKDSLERLKENIFDTRKNSILVVLNTVINSHLLTKLIGGDNRGYKIFQLSSAFTPEDKERILFEVKEKLNRKEKIILIATSIVECGVDFSFQVGFREISGILNAIQFSGRINRDEEDKRADVNIFSFDESLFGTTDILTPNPDMMVASNVFSDLLSKNRISPDYCQEAVEREIDINVQNEKRYEFNFLMVNKNLRFKSMGENFKVIPDQTISVIVDSEVIRKIKSKERITGTEIDRGSVQIFLNKFQDIKDELGIIEEYTTGYGETIFFWNSTYCSKLFGVGHGLETLRRIKVSG
jgi:CRISPR-associated endonuclease/helicase Cas3